MNRKLRKEDVSILYEELLFCDEDARAKQLNAVGNIALANSILCEVEFKAEDYKNAYKYFFESIQSKNLNQSVFLSRLILSIPIYLNLGQDQLAAQIWYFCNMPDIRKQMFAFSKRLLNTYSLETLRLKTHVTTMQEMRSLLLEGEL